MLFTEGQNEFIEKYMTYHWISPETAKVYINDLRTFNRFTTDRYNSRLVCVENITVDDVENYMHYLVHERELPPRSCNRYLYSLRSFLNYAVKKRWVEYNVASEVKPVKVIEEKKVALTQDEIQELLEAIKHPVVNFAVALLSYTGLRVIEAETLKMKDIDFEQSMLSVNGRGRIHRHIPIAKILKPYLNDYLENTREKIDSPFLLATEKTGGIWAKIINDELHRATKGLQWDKNITCQALRRSFATNLFRNGVNVYLISKLLGHASIETTTRFFLNK